MNGVSNTGVGGLGVVSVVISEPKEPDTEVEKDEQTNKEEE